ncbi:MAG: DoxX family protein [Bradymonadales bacterium]|nr:MAG: DoxX family protein [Bradymonadales bacterium]
MSFIAEIWKARFFRLSLAPWIFFVHGLPKLSHWILGISLWGPHSEFVAVGFVAGFVALLEFIASFLIMIGWHVRVSSLSLFLMFLFSAFARPLPWFFERVPVEGFDIPFAIIPSKDITLMIGAGFLGIAMFCKDEIFWNSCRSRMRRIE